MAGQPEEPTQDEMAELARFAEIRRGSDGGSALLETAPGSLQRALVYLLSALVVIGIAVAIFGRIDVVVTAAARIEPEGSTVPVQALQGGIITRVHVAPGQRVPAGHLLMELDTEEAGYALESGRRRLGLQREELERLRRATGLLQAIEAKAEQVDEADVMALTRTGEAVDLVNGLRAAGVQLALVRQRQRDELAERLRLMDMESGQLQTAITALIRSLESGQREVATAERELAARRSQRDGLEELARNGNVTRIRVAEAQTQIAVAERDLNALHRRRTDTEVDIANKRLRISALQSGVADARRQLGQEVEKAEAAFAQARDLVASHRGKLVAKIADLEAEAGRQQDTVKIKEQEVNLHRVVARIGGVLSDVAFPAPGARVAAGTRVATLVPADTPNVIIATIPSRDVGFVRPGIEARLKLDAYPFQQFGTVPALVTHVFPVPERPEFRVRLALQQEFIQVNNDHIVLFPGLSGHVDLLTQRQRIAELFIRRASKILSPDPATPAAQPPAVPNTAPAAKS